MKPLLIVMSAPSGAGKTTLCDRLLQEFPEISYSISCTTREPRGEEEDGVDYFFLSRDGFEKRRECGELLEHAQVHGNFYGTPRAPIDRAFEEGQSILMDIDVAGAAQVRDWIETLPETDRLRQGFLDIFIEPPSIDELRRRLTSRAEDSQRAIELRLKNAEDELARAGEYRYRIVNDDLELAYRRLRDVILVAAGLL